MFRSLAFQSVSTAISLLQTFLSYLTSSVINVTITKQLNASHTNNGNAEGHVIDE